MAPSGRADLKSELPPMELNRLKFGTRVKVGGKGGSEGGALDLMVLESLPRFGILSCDSVVRDSLEFNQANRGSLRV